jgi:hypothetical protein
MIERLREAFQQFGPLDGALYLFQRLLSRLLPGAALYKYDLMAQPVAERPLLPAHRGASIEVREIRPEEDIVKLLPRPQAVLRERFRQGAVCLAAFRAGRFIGFLWLLVGAYQEDEVRCRFRPSPAGGAAWDFDVYVEPQERWGFAFSRLWQEANRYLSARGVRWSLSRISAFKRDSLACHARLGSARVGSALFLCAGPWQLMLASVAPFCHLSTHPGSFPEIRLAARDARKSSTRSPATANGGLCATLGKRKRHPGGGIEPG